MHLLKKMHFKYMSVIQISTLIHKKKGGIGLSVLYMETQQNNQVEAALS